MAVPNIFTNGTNADGTEVNANFRYVDPWHDLVYNGTISSFTGILAHSATSWTGIDDGSAKVTSDSGVTWATATTDSANLGGVSKVCVADKTKAIGCDYNSANVVITSNSGVDWAEASTDPAGTNVSNLSFPTTTTAVVGMNAGTTRDIYYSADAGDTWSICTTGPNAGTFCCLDMVDGSDGLALDGSQNIWTTSDGGDNWTDSGQNMTPIPTAQSSMIALTSTTGVYLTNNETTVKTFNTTSGGTTRLSIMDVGEAQTNLSNLLKINNGNLYFIVYGFATTAASADSVSLNTTLYRSADSGVTWQQKALGNSLFEDKGVFNFESKSQLVEYDTNKLLFIVGNKQLMKIDVS